ncbi:hypothetical protein G6O69_06700 [Pseudenhygromyxa sp. WMMC2535]|uniref:hypothetical protein n=1 Tax=Pseudenhygromyxa sp. WMMC2535 TaxID=2712867 RepID=UPI0015582587|nr:hypothetical protein [Pseudenhygromyxa sp. WMMC2535]NVB37515.1 hypothetical protein [Pseudenhygromyxa sp. WMMC2535]
MRLQPSARRDPRGRLWRHATARLRLGAALLLALVLVLTALAPRLTLAAPGFTESCERALPKEEIDALISTMADAQESGACTLGHLDTAFFQTRMQWTRDADSFEVLLAPEGCLREPSHTGERLAYHAPAQLEARCPEVHAALRTFVGEPHEEIVTLVRAEHLDMRSDHDRPTRALSLAGLAWFAAMILAGVMARRSWREARALEPAQRRALAEDGVAMAALFALALGLRALVPSSLGNWYGPFLPSVGLGELRFGTSAAALQLGLRALLPWTEDLAFAMNRTIGALAVPLVMLVARRLGASRTGVLVAGVLMTFAPIPLRLSASSAEHVLAGSLAVAAWAVWLRTPRDPSLAPRLLAITLVLLAALTRVDCWPQLAAIPLWTALRTADCEHEQSSAPSWAPPRRRLVDALVFGLCWAVIGAYAYFEIVARSQHPGPSLDSVLQAGERMLPQLWQMAVTPPGWLSVVCLSLAGLGALASLLGQRWRLPAAALASLALIFVPLGRTLVHDGLTGARYFVLLLPVLAVLASAAGDHFERRILGRQRWSRAAAAIALAGAELLVVRPAWRYEYTFQAEYRFLAERLHDPEIQALDDCTLWFVRPRQPANERDLDCCLAPDRTPLTLIAPKLRFRPVVHGRELDDVRGDEPGDSCQLHYIGSPCSLDPALTPDAPKTLARIQAQCEALRRGAAGQPSRGRQQLPNASFDPRWREGPVVELLRP